MSSQAQIEANRCNALKSTGPRTPGGKAAVSRNALQHGLAALLVPPAPEVEEEITRLAREYCRHLRPHGAYRAAAGLHQTREEQTQFAVGEMAQL